MPTEIMLLDQRIKALKSLAKYANLISRRHAIGAGYDEMWRFTDLINTRIESLKKARMPPSPEMGS